MKRKPNNSHIILSERKIIEEKLNEGWIVKDIANVLHRNKSSVGREIDRHITLIFPSIYNNYHPCIKHDSCTVKSFNCYETCKNIEISLCPKLISSPHVCNGCTNKKYCRYVKRYYKANDANCEYLNSWKEDRTGMHYTEDELTVLNTDFYILVIRTKSIYHSLIVINNRGYNFNIRTIYDQIKNNKLKLKYSDLPRNRKEIAEKPDRDYKNKVNIEGHTYEDYNEYKANNLKAIEMQMDTVIGITNANDPVVLTLEIVEISFMLIFKLDRKTFDNVSKKLKDIETTITTEVFNKIFEILLTDNGSEFKDIKALIEAFPNINIFYCHPYSSFEKGPIENNHELFRRVIPKGISLKPYTQEDYNLLSSHMNSLYREKLNGKCPFDFVEGYLSIDTLNKLGLRKIKDIDVNLTPYLLGRKNIENIKKYLDYDDIKKANISLNPDQES